MSAALSNLIIDCFLILRNAFFEKNQTPKPFSLRAKGNTQDDPLDELIVSVLSQGLADANCIKAPGPLTSPDLVVYRPKEFEKPSINSLKSDSSRIVSIEIKKLQRSLVGTSPLIVRSSGLDYNTTPPCGTVRIYESQGRPLDIMGFYLFVCQEVTKNNEFIISALVLCDGNVLNEDFDLYLKITGRRQKEVGIGTYGNGVNRNRPMLIFSNPLGIREMDKACTLISRSELKNAPHIIMSHRLKRKLPNGRSNTFFAYRVKEDISPETSIQELDNPFPGPLTRVIATQSRGKFKLPIHVNLGSNDK